jgi:hypothetical protein
MLEICIETGDSIFEKQKTGTLSKILVGGGRRQNF